MYDLIKVMAAAWLMPLPFLLLLTGLGWVLLVLGWRRLGLAGVLAGLVGLALVSWAPVADRLLSPFESQYAALTDHAVVADLDYVVVLGGGWDSLAQDRPAGIRLSESSTARLFEGLRLVELARVADNLDAKLVVSGASRLDEPPIAWGYRDAAVGLGLPLSRLVVLDKPTDTGAEARAFAAWLRAQGVSDLAEVRLALVTSASHLPRAMRHFEQVGLRPVEAPTHFMAFADNPAHLSYWVPSASHLRKTERAWYEFLAGLVVEAEH
ncbi:MAG: YdcF family protein [Bacterioplanes sp.]|nr:YdcF family protein [Bacterioplanes sp.]